MCDMKGQRREEGYEAHLFLALLNDTGTHGEAPVECGGATCLQVRQGEECLGQVQEPLLLTNFSLSFGGGSSGKT